MIEELRRQFGELTHKLIVKNLENYEEGDDHWIHSQCENMFQKHEQRKQPPDQMNMLLKLKFLMILMIVVLLWIRINHQNQMGKKLKMPLNLRVEKKIQKLL